MKTLKPGYRCTCHHPARHCRYQCSGTATLVRESDGRPVCEHCRQHDPAISAGFGFGAYYFAEVSA